MSKTIFKGLKFRIYLNKKQINKIEKNFGCSRFVYNYFLSLNIDRRKNNEKKLSYNEMSSLLTKLKKQDEYAWLNEADSTSLQQSLKKLDQSYKNFFLGNKKVGFPKFKSKKSNYNSYKTVVTKRNNGTKNVNFNNSYIQIPKIGWIKFIKSQEIIGDIKNCTIIKNEINQYYISILVEQEVDELQKNNNVVGIDLGIKDFAILSDGKIFKNPKFLKNGEKKLKKEQRRLSKKKNGGKNWNKQRIKLAKVHKSISNKRNNYMQKISSIIINENQVICIENLKVVNMLKNHKLAKSIMDCSWSEFSTMLRYKSEWYGRNLLVIDAYYPSSQLCNYCKYQNKEIKDLAIREWICPKCGSMINRDLNASLNIRDEGLNMLTKLK